MVKLEQENDYNIKLKKLILLEELETKRIFIAIINSEISYLKSEIDSLNKKIFFKNQKFYVEMKRKIMSKLKNKIKEYEKYRKEINKLIELIINK